MFSGLGMLFEALPWNRKREIVEHVAAWQSQLWLEIGQIIARSVRGIRQSWTGWTRIHEKVKREARATWILGARDPRWRRRYRLNRWWWNEQPLGF